MGERRRCATRLPVDDLSATRRSWSGQPCPGTLSPRIAGRAHASWFQTSGNPCGSPVRWNCRRRSSTRIPRGHLVFFRWCRCINGSPPIQPSIVHRPGSRVGEHGADFFRGHHKPRHFPWRTTGRIRHPRTYARSDRPSGFVAQRDAHGARATGIFHRGGFAHRYHEFRRSLTFRGDRCGGWRCATRGSDPHFPSVTNSSASSTYTARCAEIRASLCSPIPIFLDERT